MGTGSGGAARCQAVQGVWRSRGYGYVARITADGATARAVLGLMKESGDTPRGGTRAVS